MWMGKDAGEEKAGRWAQQELMVQVAVLALLEARVPVLEARTLLTEMAVGVVEALTEEIAEREEEVI